jgi:hypothetical protein
LGGAIVVALGARAAFNVNAICYIPLFLTFLFWKRPHVASRLPPERIDRAILAGMRYAVLSPPIRRVLVRVFLFGVTGAAHSALAALVAKDLLHGDAATFGILLGASGIGAVAGALALGRLRAIMSTEAMTRWCAAISALALAAVGFSHSLWITTFAFLVVGAGNILTVSALNVSIQLFAPRWVTARVLSLFSSALTGGIAVCALVWGWVASAYGVDIAMIVSAMSLALTIVVGILKPLPGENRESDLELVAFNYQPDVALDLTLRSGPVIIEIDYNVDPEQARDFYGVMLRLQRQRQRNGGFGWSLSRDISNAWSWTEHYECPTWGDYLRMRERHTQVDIETQALADTYHQGPPTGSRLRRRLERPFGSVRWRAETPDLRQDSIEIYTP